MKTVTLVFLKTDDHICLAMKKRGFGEGKFNGMGGKVEEGERIEEAALRELHEEAQVQGKEEHLRSAGNIKFYFEDNPDWNLHMHIFFLHEWEGEPTETEEMAPEWFAHEEIPYERMWVDDPHWLPHVLDGKRVEGAFYFIEEGATISKHSLELN